MAVGAGGWGELAPVGALVTEGAIGLQLQVASAPMAGSALQIGVGPFEGKAGDLVPEDVGLQRVARNDVEIPPLVIRMALEASFVQPGVIPLALFDAAADLLVAVQTELVRYTAAGDMALEAVAVVFGMQPGQGAGAGQLGERFV